MFSPAATLAVPPMSGRRFSGNKKQENLTGIGVYGDPGLAETVRRDPLAIGFNNIGFAFDSKTGKQVDGLLVVPIDINANGKIDTEENFYDNLSDLNKAIAAKIIPGRPAGKKIWSSGTNSKGLPASSLNGYSPRGKNMPLKPVISRFLLTKQSRNWKN